MPQIPQSLTFDGFDGNNDGHYEEASFLVQDMGRFEELKGRPLNSHSQSSLPKYGKSALQRAGFSTKTLPAGEMLDIIAA